MTSSLRGAIAQYQTIGMKRLAQLCRSDRGRDASTHPAVPSDPVDGRGQVFEPDPTLCAASWRVWRSPPSPGSTRSWSFRHRQPDAGGSRRLHWAAAAGCQLFEYDIDPSLPVRDMIMPEAISTFPCRRWADPVRTATSCIHREPFGVGFSRDEERARMCPLEQGWRLPRTLIAHRRHGQVEDRFRHDHSRTGSDGSMSSRTADPLGGCPVQSGGEPDRRRAAGVRNDHDLVEPGEVRSPYTP